MATFPALTPSSRNFVPGIYPQREYRALSGAVVKRTFGNSPYGARLDLEYKNITDAKVVTLLTHYQTETAANTRFMLSSNVTNGMSGSLATIASATTENLRWQYDGPPTVNSIRPGISSVRIALVAEIRDPLLDM